LLEIGLHNVSDTVRSQSPRFVHELALDDLVFTNEIVPQLIARSLDAYYAAFHAPDELSVGDLESIRSASQL
jgi:hypothetical protein